MFFQQLKSQNDDLWKINLHEINISETSTPKHLQTNHVQKINNSIQETYSSVPLSVTLSKSSPVYIKQDMPGLASISIRGTSADHTAIMWGALNINSLTLGHSNVANLSTFLFEDIEIIYGSASTILGTDAIGGAVLLNSSTLKPEKIQLDITQSVASFHNYFSGIKLSIPFKKLYINTKLYNMQGRNDFVFSNPYRFDYETNIAEQDTQKNAGLHNYGIIQEIEYKFSTKTDIKGMLWFENNFHEVQPNMSANYFGGAYETISNTHLRSQLKLKHTINSQVESVVWGGYVKDFQVYKLNDTIMTNRYLIKPELFYKLTNNIEFVAGENAQIILADVHSYSEQKKEIRLQTYFSVKANYKRFNITGSYRNNYVTDYKARNVPALTICYHLLKKEYTSSRIRGTVANSYKIPTLNDRFWGTQGNKDLKEESGINYELGNDITHIKNNIRLKFNTNIFYKKIENWIQWSNKGSDWYPENFKQVTSKGIEVFSETNIQFDNWVASVNANYSFIDAVESKTYNENYKNTSLQMFYTPKHIGGLLLSINRDKWKLITSYNYYDKVYTVNDISQPNGRRSLDSYSLINISLMKEIIYKSKSIFISGSINNILNTSYMVIPNYATAGRNYSINIRLKIN
jgi:vitamin B12 transporter